MPGPCLEDYKAHMLLLDLLTYYIKELLMSINITTGGRIEDAFMYKNQQKLIVKCFAFVVFAGRRSVLNLSMCVGLGHGSGTSRGPINLRLH